MSQSRSIGGLFTLAPGQTVLWTTVIGNGLDGGIVVQAPNIIDDVIGSDQLVVVNRMAELHKIVRKRLRLK